MGKRFLEWFRGDDKKTEVKHRRPKAPKLRKGLEPGKVLILLSGRFRGKRVVFLKQLPSGLLLVTGPLKVNGVPLKRVNQSYTISTSTMVSVQGVDVSKVDDALFKKAKVAKKPGQAQFFDDKAKKEVSAERKGLQKSVDAALIKNLKADKEKLITKYLQARFSLVNSDKPHLMNF
mmetsp:Transcript_26919/g.20135  ORF Transcript_26919/g.20135 Transcript_26919/m.20135 type:complete len:176 (-) Transcript_26919:29-556(-)